MVTPAGERLTARLEAAAGDETEVRVRMRADGHVLTARFECAEGWMAPNPDTSFTAALPVAMMVAHTMELPDGVSPGLLARSETIQDLLGSWDRRLRRIKLLPGAAGEAPAGPGRGTAAFFTGGVDSFYTLLTRRGEIDALVYAHGLDLPYGEVEKRAVVSASLREVAGQLGLPMIEIDTDLRALSDPFSDWERIYTSAALAAIAHLLAHRFERVLLPATHSYRDLHPSGSHPLLDPLYSSDALRIEHVDALTRVEKLEYLVESDLAMSSLRVCWQPGVDGLNCGVCRKCVRTMTGLRVVGAPGRCRTLPAELPIREMNEGRIPSYRSLTYVRENLAALEATGRDPELALVLRRLVAQGAREEAWAEAKNTARTAGWLARTRGGEVRRRLARALRRAPR